MKKLMYAIEFLIVFTIVFAIFTILFMNNQSTGFIYVNF